MTEKEMRRRRWFTDGTLPKRSGTIVGEHEKRLINMSLEDMIKEAAIPNIVPKNEERRIYEQSDHIGPCRPKGEEAI